MTTKITQGSLDYLRNNTWAWFAGWLTEESVKASFEQRYGYEPEYIIIMKSKTLQHTRIYAGPVK